MSTYTQDQYNKLVSAIAQGVRIVMYADKRVEYRNLEDMQRIKEEMEVDLGIINPAVGRNRRVIRGGFRKGIYPDRIEGGC